MRKHPIHLSVLILLVCLFGLAVLAGCETTKGLGRDIKKVDEWVKDHMW